MRKIALDYSIVDSQISREEIESREEEEIEESIGELDRRTLASAGSRAFFPEALFPLPELNFEKVKGIIQNSKDPPRVCAVLQALRWRITRTQHGTVPKEILQSYVENDILGYSNKGSKIFQSLINHSNKKIVEYFTLFINVLAAYKTSLRYLIQNEEMIILLIKLVYDEKGESNIRQNALGTLKNISLYRRPQIIMIESDIIRWIVGTLKSEEEELSQYTIEDLTTLLMKFSQRTAGKIKCEEPSLDILKVLNKYIEPVIKELQNNGKNG